MRHLDDGRLRAYLDEQLPHTDQAVAAQHLADCDDCRRRLAVIERTAQHVALALDRLAPQKTPSVESALFAIQVRDRTQSSTGTIWRSMMNRRVTRAIAISVVVLAMLVGVFSFAPTRTLARQFLSVFRVRKFAVVQVNPNGDQMEAVVNALSDTLIAQEPEVYVDEPAVPVANVDEASAVAGFQVRMPSDFPGDGPIQIEVKGRTEMGMALGPDSLPVLFELAGMDPALAPDDLGDGMIRAMIPSMAMIENQRYSLVQVLDPVVEYPEGVDPALIGEAGLRIMGMEAGDAQRLSQSIDWANTMLLPVPTELVEVRETVVAGSEAVLMIPRDGDERPTLMWERDDVVYVLSGAGAFESLARIAESMFE